MNFAVRVQETRVFATQLAADWWESFSRHHSGTKRLSIVSHSLGGAVVDVTCDDEGHALWLVEHMAAEGIPRSALKVIRSQAAG